MLTANGYTLVYYKKRNQIVISLPQTSRTLTNTLEPVVDRRIDVEDKELAILLTAIQAIFLNGTSSHGERKEDAELVGHGRWIKMSDADGIYYACSECGNELPRVINSFDPQFDLFPKLECIDKTTYCPNCGAKMDEVEDV